MASGRKSPQKAPVIPIDSGNHREKVRSRCDELVTDEKHLEMVARIARGVHAGLQPSFDVEDLIGIGRHYLLIAALRYSPEDHNDTPFAGFAWPIVHGGIVSSVRNKNQRENTRPGLEDAEEPYTAPDFEAEIDKRTKLHSVAVAIDLLPDRERQLMKLYYSDSEPTLAEVSEELGVSVRTAKRVHASAIDKVRTLLRA